MKSIAALIVLVLIGAAIWLLMDSDRARLKAWADQWAQHAAELQIRIDGHEAKADALEVYWKRWVNGAISQADELVEHKAELHAEIALLRDENGELREEVDGAAERIADLVASLKTAEHPIIHRVRHKHHRHHCNDNIADYLNGRELLRHTLPVMP